MASWDCTLKGLTIGAVNWVFILAWTSDTSISYTLISVIMLAIIGMAALQKFSPVEVNYSDVISSAMSEDWMKWLHETMYNKINQGLNFIRSVMMLKWVCRTIGTIFTLAIVVTLFSSASNLSCLWFLANALLVAPLIKIPDDVKTKACNAFEKLNGEYENILAKIPSYKQIERMEKYKVDERQDVKLEEKHDVKQDEKQDEKHDENKQ